MFLPWFLMYLNKKKCVFLNLDGESDDASVSPFVSHGAEDE